SYAAQSLRKETHEPDPHPDPTPSQDEDESIRSTALANKQLTVSSSVLRGVQENLSKYPNCVLLTQVGEFYELYYEQADTIGGDILGLQVTDKRYAKTTVRFTGFPIRSLDRYLDILVIRNGLSVALCQQFPTEHNRSFVRRVTRIISPGTLITHSYLNDSGEHHYLLCVTSLTLDNDTKSQDTTHSDPNSLGLAWIDLATGDFMTLATNPDDLPAHLARIRPIELLLCKDDLQAQKYINDIHPSTLSPGPSSTTTITLESSDFFSAWIKESEYINQGHFDLLADESHQPNGSNQNSLELCKMLLDSTEQTSLESTASRSLLNYILKTQVGLLPPLQPPQRYQVEDTVKMMNSTIQNLELIRPIFNSNNSMTFSNAQLSTPLSSSLPPPSIPSSPLSSLLATQSSKQNTLIGQLNRTKTTAGSRLLTERLLSPSTSIEIINNRLDLVEFFIQTPIISDIVRDNLGDVKDAQRSVHRLSLNCGIPNDMLSIASTLKSVSKIKKELGRIIKSEKRKNNKLMASDKDGDADIGNRRVNILKEISKNAKALYPLDSIWKKIEEMVIDENEEKGFPYDTNSVGLNNDSTGGEYEYIAKGFLKPNCTKKLQKMHTQIMEKELYTQKLRLDWQKQFNAPTLKLATMSALGHYIEVSKKDGEKLADVEGFRLIQSLKGKMRFEHKQWTYLLSDIELLKLQLKQEEKRLFEELRGEILGNSSIIRQNCNVLAALDVAISMSIIAKERWYIRPTFISPESSASESQSLSEPHVIYNGRHPVVEQRLLEDGRQFVPNSCYFNTSQSLGHQTILLTGPNMGGKSTFLRQVALVSIMAQMGSFVPATNAQLHIVDSIYTRIGAYDNLAQNQSTFMVEMFETAMILKYATRRSLVIMDEIGRGTSTSDGISIAFATLEYIHDKVGCKALFATHYHELAELCCSASVTMETAGEEEGKKKKKRRNDGLSGVGLFHTAVKEQKDGSFLYIHKVLPGICHKSHGLYVAKLAGIPEEVIQRAQEFSQYYPDNK
ncbi:MutS protein 1, partial [Mycoemilia scoparia]